VAGEVVDNPGTVETVPVDRETDERVAANISARPDTSLK
jgi:hypothetical protein